MVRVDDQCKSAPDGSAWIELYRCAACWHGLATYWELTGNPTEDQQSFVEREIAAKGSFFPQDYQPGRFRR